jgi:hypothetical protein
LFLRALRWESARPAVVTPRAPRVAAPLLWRSAGLRLFGPEDRRDPRLPAIRAFTDEKLRVGDRLIVEIFLLRGSVEITVRVAELAPLGGFADYEATLEVVRIEEEDVDRIEPALRH